MFCSASSVIEKWRDKDMYSEPSVPSLYYIYICKWLKLHIMCATHAR
jgi:hypothetical protein